jgi:hypothetical protein
MASREDASSAGTEHLEKRENPGFVVTSLSRHDGLPGSCMNSSTVRAGSRKIDQITVDTVFRPDQHRLSAEQSTLCFSSVAYVLFQVLRRLGLPGTDLAKARCSTIRLKLLKIGTLIRISVHKMWVSLAGGYPYLTLFRQVHEKLRAVPLKC